MSFLTGSSQYISSLLGSILLYVVIPTIFIPICYVVLEENFLNRILSRIYNVNFSIRLIHMCSLLLGYVVGSFIVAYAIKDIFEFSSSIIEYAISKPLIGFSFYNPIDDEANLRAIAVSSVALCFTSRIISRLHGYAKGKQLHSFISSMALIMFFINVFYGIGKFGIENSFESTNIIRLFITYWISFYESFIFHTTDIFEYFIEIFPIVLISSLTASSIGECVILCFNPHHRSIPCILEKFPSDFELITSDKLKDKIEKITDKDIESLKIATKTLFTCEILYRRIRRLMVQDAEIIIKAPEIEESEIKSRESRDNYRHRRVEFCKMVNSGKVKWIRKGCNNFRIIIIDNNEVLLIVKAGDFTKRKVGIYSKEPYIVESCISTFNGALSEAEMLSKIKKLVSKEPNQQHELNVTLHNI